mgnify:FL=1
MIDWVTVIAQIINFIILVVLLKIFLYDRVIEAMDKRQQTVQDRFDQAEQQQARAEEAERDYQQQKQDLDDRREDLLAEARQQAEDLRHDQRQQAEQDLRRQKAQWLDTLGQRREDFLAELRRTAAGRLGHVAAKVQADLADSDLQQHVVAVFARRVDQLDDDRRQQLRDALAGRDGPVRVAAAFDLTEEQADTVRSAVADLTDDDAPELDLARDEDLICGLEVQAGGHAVGWNVAEYLDALQDDLNQAIDDRIRQLRDDGDDDRRDTSDVDDRDDNPPDDDPNAGQTTDQEPADDDDRS